MKFVISNQTRAVYWMEVGDVLCARLHDDGTFDVREASLVDHWPDIDPSERKRILDLLAQ
jgi:hypothetical protein